MPLDEAPAGTRQPRVFLLTNLVERRAQMTQHVKLVEDDPGLRCVAALERRVPERLPHVHHRQANLPAFLGAEPAKELIHASFGAVFPTEPDRPLALQIADDDPVGMPRSDRDLIDADDRGGRRSGLPQLLGHVLLVEVFDRFPRQVQFLSHILDRRTATATTDGHGQALGIARVVGQPVEALALHGVAASAGTRRTQNSK